MRAGPHTRTLAIFPLGGVVLFPHTRQLLHIFEPRYLQMTEDALTGDACFGMILPRNREAVEDPVPIFDVGCLGRILTSKRLQDGRYRLLLEGDVRFRVVEELPSATLYRCVTAELLPEPSFEELLPQERAELTELRPLLEGFLLEMARLGPEGATELRERVSILDAIQLAHILAFGLDCTPLEKQALLEAPGPLERCRQLACLIEFQRVEARLPQGPPTLN